MEVLELKPVAEGVLLIEQRPPNPNAYLVEGVLIDSATRIGRRRLLATLRGSHLVAHVLTHVHPPTQGASHAVASTFGVDVHCGAADVEALRSGDARPWQPPHLLNDLQNMLLAGPGVSKARELKEGDVVGGFEVLQSPGHSPGHIALWRKDDKVLIVGDVLNNASVWTGKKGLREPPAVFTADPATNRNSARRLATLGAETVLFSHGPPLRDGAKFAEFVNNMID